MKTVSEETVSEDVECEVSRKIDAMVESIAGLGASDCGCDSHLGYATERERLVRVVRQAHENATQRRRSR